MAGPQTLFLKVAVQERLGRSSDTDTVAWQELCRVSATEPEDFKFLRVENTKATPPGISELVYSAKGTPRS